uniref:Protein kinase domain-containing protein n=1 Tax=Salix viminalis TaxID=40686 RepID=A0A6N2NF58_SALVM
MNPKISDFGMARIFAMDRAQDSTGRVVGTFHGENRMKVSISESEESRTKSSQWSNNEVSISEFSNLYVLKEAEAAVSYWT